MEMRFDQTKLLANPRAKAPEEYLKSGRRDIQWLRTLLKYVADIRAVARRYDNDTVYEFLHNLYESGFAGDDGNATLKGVCCL